MSIVVTPFKLIVGDDPDTINDPVISALPLLDPSHSDTRPVNPEPFPTNDPENIEPDIADTPVKLTTVPTAPDTTSDPVILALPFLTPSHPVEATPVSPDPSPLKEPVKDCAITDWDTSREPDIVTVLAVKSPPISGLPA